MPEETADNLIIPSEVTEAENATLALEEKDGTYALKATGGPTVPASIRVVDAAGNAVATYTAGPPITSRMSMGERYEIVIDFDQFQPGSQAPGTLS
ncbi:hypothetical protein [Streptomyces sp. NPDC060031]|uniref:hypothetical protein n=1 Tax=Streptomyces sp. NPDC060031 TaxID=3347043 RepID=UPI0036B892A2